MRHADLIIFRRDACRRANTETIMQEQFQVQNVKCGGCVSAIQTGLQTLDGVSDVAVDIPSGQVTVTGTALSRAQLSVKLTALGYPERPAG
jgi:copper chaperone